MGSKKFKINVPVSEYLELLITIPNDRIEGLKKVIDDYIEDDVNES
mgnify:CR=1 FL=1